MASQSTTRLTNAASVNKFNLLEGVALNATESLRTVTVDLDGRWTGLRLFVFHTNSAATTVTIAPSVSNDGTTYTDDTSRSISAGASTVSSLAETCAVSGNKNFSLSYEVAGLNKIKFILGGASAGGSDLVSVQVSVSVS